MTKIVFQRVISDFVSKFPFINLQIKSIVESLRPIMLCTQSMKTISDLLKNMQFGVKIGFQKFSNFSKSVGRILLTPLAFWKLLIWTSCLSCLEIISNDP